MLRREYIYFATDSCFDEQMTKTVKEKKIPIIYNF